MSLSERLGSASPPSEFSPERMRERIELKLDALLETGRASALSTSGEAGRLEALVYSAIDDVVTELNAPISPRDLAGLVQEIADDRLGHGVLENLLRDDSVTEIMVTRFDQIYLERAGVLSLSDQRFRSELQVRKTIERMVGRVGRRVDESNPLVDARLEDGSRINAVLPPVALDGATLTIRKFGRQRLDLRAMVAAQTLSQKQAEFLVGCIADRKNIVISGGTGSGKSTTLNALCSFIDAGERVVTIEDSAELQIEHAHLVRLETRPRNSEGVGEITVRDLVRNSLRMRPDRIIVGEVRDAAALDMLQAMNTGHDGSLTTVHANSPADALRRIETMCLMSELQLPLAAIRAQIASAIDLVVQQVRLPDGSRRITKIVALAETEDGGYLLSEVGS
jgi:pilus assembly protein CpaF